MFDAKTYKLINYRYECIFSWVIKASVYSKFWTLRRAPNASHPICHAMMAAGKETMLANQTKMQ